MTKETCPPGEALSAYADRQTSPLERSLLEAHLGLCEECRRDLRALDALKRAVAAAPAPAMPHELRSALEGMARAAKAASAPPRTPLAGWPDWRLLVRPAALVPLAAAALFLLALCFRGRAGREPEPGLELPVELLTAAHDEYARTMPLASAERGLPPLPVQVAGASKEGGDVY